MLGLQIMLHFSVKDYDKLEKKAKADRCKTVGDYIQKLIDEDLKGE